MLHVRVARQLNIALAVAEVRERSAQVLDASGEVEGCVAQVEAQRGQDLVVTRPAEMQSSAGLANVLRQAGLERRVHVLVLEGDLPFAGLEALLQGP